MPPKAKYTREEIIETALNIVAEKGKRGNSMAYQIFKPISQVQGVLFDMDGVIINSEPVHYEAYRQRLVAKSEEARTMRFE